MATRKIKLPKAQRTALPADHDPLLSPPQVSEMLSVAEQTLAHWRSQGRKLPYIRISRRCVRYRLSDVRTFLEQQRREISPGVTV